MVCTKLGFALNQGLHETRVCSKLGCMKLGFARNQGFTKLGFARTQGLNEIRVCKNLESKRNQGLQEPRVYTKKLGFAGKLSFARNQGLYETKVCRKIRVCTKLGFVRNQGLQDNQGLQKICKKLGFALSHVGFGPLHNFSLLSGDIMAPLKT